MIKSVFGLLIVGLALVPFTQGQRQIVQVANVTAMPSIAPKADFVGFTVNSTTGQSCKIEMLGAGNQTVIRVQVEPACDHVSAGLSQAVSWVNGDKGMARLVGSDGQTILSFGPSDGFAYETIGSDIVTLTES